MVYHPRHIPLVGAFPVFPRSHLRLAETLGRLLLRLRVQVLDLGLAEDHVRVGRRALVHVGLGDHEEDVLALLHRHAHDGRDRLHAQLLHRLPCLLLVAVLLGSLRLRGHSTAQHSTSAAKNVH